MRLLFISPYPPVRDGIGDYTSALATALTRQRHEVRVIAARSKDGELAPEALAEMAGPVGGVGEVLAAIRGFDPDVVHVQFAVAGFGVRTLGLLQVLRALRDSRAKVVVTFHEVTRDTETLRAPGRRLYRAVAACADASLVHNQRAAAAFARITPGCELTIVPHPEAQLPAATTTPAELRARLGLDGRVLLAFGFIHVDKGLDVLVDALARLRQDPRFADVTLLVAGTVRPRSGPFKPFEWRDRVHLRTVRRAIVRDGVHPHVVFSGYVPSGEMAPTFGLAEITVLPYRRIEDSGVANLALAAGATMVVTDAGVLPEYVRDPARRVPGGDASALAATLAAVLDGAVAAPADDTDGLPGATFPEVVEATLGVYRSALSR